MTSSRPWPSTAPASLMAASEPSSLLQMLLQPDGAAVHDLDDLVDPVAQLKAAVFDLDPALAEGQHHSVQIEELSIHLLTSPS